MSSRSDGFFPQAETMTPYDKGYQKGRADAIDEILPMIKALGSSKRIMDIVYRAEQIKEQTNEAR